MREGIAVNQSFMTKVDKRTQPCIQNEMEAVYLGVEGYGTVTSAEKDCFKYRFSINGETRLFRIFTAGSYAIQNCLEEGCFYRITEKGGVVTAVRPAGGIIGRVTAVKPDGIWVGDQSFSIGRCAGVDRITTEAGGASVISDTARIGDGMRISTEKGDTVRRIYTAFLPECYAPPVSGIPGRRTLKNFLATALMPVGTVLYVFGGGWNWQDTGSGCYAQAIGLSPSWIHFFQAQDAAYTYKNLDPAHSYYPFNGWNQYHYAGLDCSGYVGWTVYNTLNLENGRSGWVMSAKKMARTFAENGWGTWTQTEQDFRPGDVFSMSGHVWICLGSCSDGSLVILHSTPSESRSGNPGGGVQLSALNPKGGRDCEAYRLSDRIMKAFYPRWSERYEAVTKSDRKYTVPADSGPAAEWSGRFRWNLDGGVLTDTDGYSRMSAGEILADLFGKTRRN